MYPWLAGKPFCETVILRAATGIVRNRIRTRLARQLDAGGELEGIP